MNKILEKVAAKILKEAKSKGVVVDFNIIDNKSCLIINVEKRKATLITINALDDKEKELLAFGISVRKSNWQDRLKNTSAMDLIGKLGNGAFKALELKEVVRFMS